ncbi:ChaN family lipoprotein [uncultured Jannaschia sp.]|uniref:ChaN family lipoprotein n=1 Tax=uncultured Jannaschia sp. TaxID=293347 RepID=UPI00261E0FF1|nr:ChaN family lipoprotein [uncultured Jannaschia sp.]
MNPSAAIAAALILWTGAVLAADLPDATIYVIGEIHGNPEHHRRQAELVAMLAPKAVIFEQLTDEQADRIGPDTPRTAETLGPMLDWDESGWPDIGFYAQIMAASDGAIVGAAGTPGDLAPYDLGAPLPDEQQAEREALQAAVHCDALPAHLLPQFVDRQRAIDAQFAARTLAALDAHGAPVVLITGNGHARRDWGVPAAIARVRPDVAIIVVVQGEDGRVPPGGDVVFDAPAPERPDPCDAFR